MCTTIATSVKVRGAAKGPGGWVSVDEADIGYDHATRLWTEHAVRLDLRCSAAPDADHIAVELELASAKALLSRLADVIAAAERHAQSGAAATSAATANRATALPT